MKGKTAEKPFSIKMKFDGWIIRNMNNYGNSLIPKDLLNTVKYDVDVLKNLIEYAYEKPVRIRKTDSGYIVEDVRRK